VILSAAGTFSAAGWSFSNWPASDRVILSDTAGAGEVVAGEVIDGGTHTRE
jgi:hypothetical protein